MVINIFYILGITGLILIILGILVKNRKRELRDLLYIIGGVCLTFYSIYIKDYIFITLQIVFTLVAVYDSIKSLKKDKK